MIVLHAVLTAFVLGIAPTAQKAVAASDAWVTEAPAGGTASAYLSIDNPTMYDVYIVSASSDAAGTVELRDGDKPVKAITVASFGSAELASGGAFLKLSGLKRPLKGGETIQLTLVTDGGVTLVTTAVVKAM